MNPSRPLRVLLLSLACSAALAAQAQTATRIDIPAGDLAGALDAYARQTGTQLVYRADQLKGARSAGLSGQAASAQSLDALLKGSGFRAQRDASGAVLIVPAAASAKPAAPAQPAPQARPTQAATDAPVTTNLDTIQVTGSRIPRAQVEGPAPITIVTSAQIQAAGFTTVPDVLRSLSQNSGTVQGQQNTTSAQSTPGAQAVDLRGLGPNHTLVLVNGRRIADFPLPLNGKSNFTDIGNIPLGMIDRIEVLTGSASAVYGSDAMAGVINFVLKKSADGTIIDYRYGDTERGGGASHNLTLATSFERDGFSGIVGLELIDKRPLWGYQRKIQDSTLDGPTERSRMPTLVARRYDRDDAVALDPADGCATMASLNGGSTALARDRWGEPYCGSDQVAAQRTITNQRKGATAYGSFEYRLGDNLSWFADIQLGHQEVKLMTGNGSATSVSDNMGWQFQDASATGSNAGYFHNARTGHIEKWQRQFSPEEVGGLKNRMNTTTQKTLSLATGLKGGIGDDWNWELAFNHSQYKAKVAMPRIRTAAANRLFLGERLGYDANGYAIYNADPARLFKPLTEAEFATIAAMSTFRPDARSSNISFTADTPSLFSMPAGDAGFATAVEFGHQSYDLNPDPQALTADAYFGPRYGDGSGSRNRWSAAGELRMPLLSSLQASLASRYDRYGYSGQHPGKFTYSLGLEWRPLDALLVRSSYGTGFRAPDMHYLFAGDDYYRKTSTDYFRCRTDKPDFSNGNCWDDGRWDVETRDVYSGNRSLNVETSTSASLGFVWSPSTSFDLAVDYYRIRVMNQVQTQDRERLRITEADCRLGVTAGGQAMAVNSPTCQDAIARVIRKPDGSIDHVNFGPINVANEETTGVDASANYRLKTAAAGDFRFSGNYTWVQKHSFQGYPGDTPKNMLHYSTFSPALPRIKSNLGVNWDKDAWGASLFGSYLGRVPNYDDKAWIRATWRINAGARHDINDHLRVSLSINNLLDKMPPKDATWAPYPYYDTSWFDAIGRAYFLQVTWKLGGKALD